jgi:hypothetical protein
MHEGDEQLFGESWILMINKNDTISTYVPAQSGVIGQFQQDSELNLRRLIECSQCNNAVLAVFQPATH